MPIPIAAPSGDLDPLPNCGLLQWLRSPSISAH
uniref:Uncharacterized protein n=1 Tax=Arundo donax TaxID=35708 RepID=A0A0A8YES1_ARUDO